MLDVTRAAALLRAGELVGIPTETVYGLGADARNPTAVAKIFAAKGRPADHPLIVHLPDAAALAQWAIDIPDSAYRLAATFWPGPLTLILKRHPDVPDAVTGGQDTIGLRVPDHPLALALLHEFKGGIAAPSANKFGRISPTTAQHVRDEFGDAIPVLDGGPCGVGIESTIVDVSCGSPAILRPGQVGRDALAAVLGVMPQSLVHAVENERDRPRVSGSLNAHYAPRTPMRLVPSAELSRVLAELAAQRRKIVVLARRSASNDCPALRWLAAPIEPEAFAHDLYANLRTLDGAGADLMVVEAPATQLEWAAIADRLGRAALGSGQ